MKDNCRKIKILWVTHDFPPRRTSGIYRPVKIYKYIDKDQYTIDFLTQSVFLENCTLDYSLIEELQPVPCIYRIPNIVLDNIISSFYQKYRLKNFKPKTEIKQHVLRKTKLKKTNLKKLCYRLWMMVVYFPDQFFIWGWLAAIKALFLHMRRGYDIIYTTSHPQSGHLAGFLLSMLGVAWIADYRDGGVLVHPFLLSKNYPKGVIRKSLEHYYQKAVLKKADQVIAHSECLKSAFIDQFSVDENKITAISNGFDESDFCLKGSSVSQDILQRKAELHLLHLGIWYLSSDDSIKILKILNLLASNLANKGIDVILHAVGFDLYPSELLIENRPKFKYQFHSILPHDQIIDFLLNADIYLLSSIYYVSIPGILPGKLWEYLRGGKPILLFGEKDEAWEIIQTCTSGMYIDINGRDPLLAEKIISLVNTPISNVDAVKKYSWKARSREMESIFSKCSIDTNNKRY
jgi:glycosyltransferase involved in cell wall biosynthesis